MNVDVSMPATGCLVSCIWSDNAISVFQYSYSVLGFIIRVLRELAVMGFYASLHFSIILYTYLLISSFDGGSPSCELLSKCGDFHF